MAFADDETDDLNVRVRLERDLGLRVRPTADHVTDPGGGDELLWPPTHEIETNSKALRRTWVAQLTTKLRNSSGVIRPKWTDGNRRHDVVNVSRPNTTCVTSFTTSVRAFARQSTSRASLSSWIACVTASKSISA